MTKLSAKDVEHVAKLAKLSLKPGEVEKFRQQLGEVLEYVDQLNKINTNKIKPTSQVTGLKNRYREDKKAASLSSQDALKNSPSKIDDYFKVKAILDK